MPPAPPQAPARVVRSYNVRFQVDALLRSDGGEPPTLVDAVDIHTHAAPHRENPFSLAQRATQAGMGAVVYKDLAAGHKPPAEACREVQDHVNRWAEAEGLRPVQCFYGARTEPQDGGVEFEQVRAAVKGGARCIWFPVISSAYNHYRVGSPRRGIMCDDYEGVMVGPLAWEEALRCGQYLLEDDGGALKPVVRDILRLAADNGVAVSFAHSSKPEMEAMAEECTRLKYKQAILDHPYGPHIGLAFDDLRPFIDAGVTMNFTYDEISPLLGVYPQDMVDTVKALGAEHFTLSSDGGNPLLPAAVDALQTLINYLRAFGLSSQAIRMMTIDNPRRVLGPAPIRAVA